MVPLIVQLGVLMAGRGGSSSHSSLMCVRRVISELLESSATPGCLLAANIAGYYRVMLSWCDHVQSSHM